MSGSRLGEADRAVEIAVGVYLYYPETGMLLMLGTRAAIVRATLGGLGVRNTRFLARPAEPLNIQISLRVTVYKRLKLAVLVTGLSQENLVIPCDDDGVELTLALRADRARTINYNLVLSPDFSVLAN